MFSKSEGGEDASESLYFSILNRLVEEEDDDDDEIGINYGYC